MKGFSTIEILIAFAVGLIAMVAISEVAYSMPLASANMVQEREALLLAQDTLHNAVHEARANFSDLQSFASISTSSPFFSTVLSIDSLDDEHSKIASSRVTWKSLLGTDRHVQLQTVLTDASSTNPCDTFVSGNWAKQVQINYSLNSQGILPESVRADSYPISGLSVTKRILAATVSTTTNSNSPTLFLFSISEASDTPEYIGSFDNASTSRTGFSSVAAEGGYVFAGNSFGSASAQTCNDGISCSQVQIFSVSTGTPVARVSAITLATSSPPYAVVVGGASAGTHTLFYREGFLYAGLEKTIQGDEFNIFDVHDPFNARWVSGLHVGRTVTAIGVRGTTAFIGTDDPARELLAINIENPKDPRIVGSWNAPGSSGFGYGSALTVNDSRIRFGRTYIGNAPELTLLNKTDLTHIQPIATYDEGTPSKPQSVRAVLTQGFLTFVLLTDKLEIWNSQGEDLLSTYSPAISLSPNTNGTSLACFEDSLLVGGVDQKQGTGFISLFHGV